MRLKQSMPIGRRGFAPRWALIAGLAALSPLAVAGGAGSGKAQALPEDAIQVVGHIALPAGSITALTPTRHFSSDYVYAEYATGRKVVILDVTNPVKPSVVSDLAYPVNGSPSVVVAAAGTTALAIGNRRSSAAGAQTVRIVSFADAEHPKVLREFTGVTAIGRDSSRGLTFLAGPAGVWILQDRLAEDPALEAAYANHVMYDR